VMTIGGQLKELDGRPGVLITVQDLGDGFQPEDSERLFDAFYTTKPEALGLGLRIGRSIVEAHGGGLWATLHDPHGAMFSCALPAEGE
jgi:signal transduction histidine kinase